VSTIHDLGYARYAGARRPTSTRWRVIARNTIAVAWKTWWRFKASLGLAVVTTFIAGGLLYFASEKLGMLARDGMRLRLVDSVLPQSIAWFCRAAFLPTLTVGAGMVAGDVASGAFTFYFARSLRPRDYVIGRLAGFAFLMSTIMLVGPLAIALLRLGLSASSSELVDNLIIVPKALAIGACGVLVYAAIPLGFSALVGSRRSALALWAAYYLVVGNMAYLLGMASSGWIGALDLPSSLQSIAFAMFDVQFNFGSRLVVPTDAAVISIVAHASVAIVIMFVQVRRAQQSGVGGSS
jgi:hypothetical protein